MRNEGLGKAAPKESKKDKKEKKKKVETLHH
jgi:hypothetical protein